MVENMLPLPLNLARGCIFASRSGNHGRLMTTQSFIISLLRESSESRSSCVVCVLTGDRCPLPVALWALRESMLQMSDPVHEWYSGTPQLNCRSANAHRVSPISAYPEVSTSAGAEFQFGSNSALSAGYTGSNNDSRDDRTDGTVRFR